MSVQMSQRGAAGAIGGSLQQNFGEAALELSPRYHDTPFHDKPADTPYKKFRDFDTVLLRRQGLVSPNLTDNWRKSRRVDSSS